MRSANVNDSVSNNSGWSNSSHLSNSLGTSPSMSRMPQFNCPPISERSVSSSTGNWVTSTYLGYLNAANSSLTTSQLAYRQGNLERVLSALEHILQAVRLILLLSQRPKEHKNNLRQKDSSSRPLSECINNFTRVDFDSEK